VRAGLRADIEAFNRGKRSVTLDLRNPESKEIIHRLLVILIRTLL
jgi:crotonobetainyl-CoA:carnitine CoA-transferase CaiB-like acyl-CoA transferase